MKNKFKFIFGIILLLFVVFLSLFWGNYSQNKFKVENWGKYVNEEEGLSFMYPKEWGNPEVHSNKNINEFSVSFNNYTFSVDNGYHFLNSNGLRPTIPELIKYYKIDMENGNEIQDFEIEDVEINGNPATKVTLITLTGKHYIDLYVSNKNSDKQNDFLFIKINQDVIDKSVYEKIISSLLLKTSKE